MGMAAPRAPVGGRSPEPPKGSVTSPTLLVTCYLKIKLHKNTPFYAIDWIRHNTYRNDEPYLRKLRCS